ncbi:MAG: GAF domain-containing sensor histidine kinase [Nocardioides sp.]|nr:GAF domain-containing sensor histidine kinase [Nocardioides sp.]
MDSPTPKPAGGHRLTVPPGFAPPPLGGRRSGHELTMTTITVDLGLVSGEDFSDLQLIADSLTALAGFEIAAIAIARPDDMLHMAVVSGSDSARVELVGKTTPIATLEKELARADDWGFFQFVPAERVGGEEQVWGWVPEMPPNDAEGAWDPLDLLVAPLRDAAGTLRGTLTVDVPSDGMRPGPERRALLTRHAVQAQRAVLLALEREHLAEQVRLAEAARDVIRRAGRELDPDQILASLSTGLVGVLELSDLWVHVAQPGGGFRSHVKRSDASLPTGGVPEIMELVVYSRHLWQQRDVSVQTSAGAVRNPHPDPLVQQKVTDFLAAQGIASAVCVPLGSGETWYGAMVLGRRVTPSAAVAQGTQGSQWSDLELITVSDLGHDFGRVIHNTRAYDRQREAVRSLRELESHKSRLIATVAHELKNPLSAFRWNIEMLPYAESEAEYADVLAALTRNRDRTEQIVSDLAVLSRVSDPDHLPTKLPIAVAPVLQEIRKQLEHDGRLGQQHRLVFTEAHGAAVSMAPGELDRVLLNLVTNALKYSPEGGTVTITTRVTAGLVEISVSDEGIGISAADQERLFTEFFRSTNPAALKQPGTGLGLTIVSRIVKRRGGRIDVASAPGSGSTFRVTLPSA